MFFGVEMAVLMILAYILIPVAIVFFVISATKKTETMSREYKEAEGAMQIGPRQYDPALVKRGKYAVGIAMVIWVVHDLAQGHPSSASARFQWLEAFSIQLMGAWGFTILQALLGVFFLGAAFFHRD